MLMSFLQKQGEDKKKIVFIARGGNSSPLWTKANAKIDSPVSTLAKALLQLPNVVVVLLGKHDSEFKLLQTGVFAISYLNVHFVKLLPLTHLIIHHGK